MSIFEQLLEEMMAAKASVKPPPPPRKWMTVNLFADHMHLHPYTVRRYIKQGLPAIKAGHGWRINVQQAERWLEVGGARAEAERCGRS